MTNANPRVEICYRVKGNKRWFRTYKVYALKRIEEAQNDMKKMYKEFRGTREYLLKPFVK